MLPKSSVWAEVQIWESPRSGVAGSPGSPRETAARAVRDAQGQATGTAALAVTEWGWACTDWAWHLGHRHQMLPRGQSLCPTDRVVCLAKWSKWSGWSELRWREPLHARGVSGERRASPQGERGRGGAVICVLAHGAADPAPYQSIVLGLLSSYRLMKLPLQS